MRTAVVLLTRDLRVHDNPALATACASAEAVVPLHVLDPALLGRSPNRDRFLHQSLADLRSALIGRGGDLVIRRGDPVAETIRLAGEVGAEAVAVSADVSRYARRREERLRKDCDQHRLALRLFPGLTVVDPGTLTPSSSDHYRVFTPYHRAWAAATWRQELAAPERVPLPAGVSIGRLPDPPIGESPAAAVGGETAAEHRLHEWLDHVVEYGETHNDLAADSTSRLSPYLRFGCLSPLTLANSARSRGESEPYLRQLCWRDFYYQVANAFPDLATRAYRSAAIEPWREAPDAFAAWADGRTGVPIVDAGMRQLRAEGWMHNRARLVAASHLSKQLRIDWRLGYAEFGRWLLDGDLPNNAGNWQWVAGTGNDTRPYRRFSPQRQAERYDPAGGYVARYVT
jgi:deoxyribodipyrimidine photo-lyase